MSGIFGLKGRGKEHFRRMDILANHAGLGLTGPVEEQDEESWERMVAGLPI